VKIRVAIFFASLISGGIMESPVAFLLLVSPSKKILQLSAVRGASCIEVVGEQSQLVLTHRDQWAEMP
jgi:hypothetical protein